MIRDGSDDYASERLHNRHRAFRELRGLFRDVEDIDDADRAHYAIWFLESVSADENGSRNNVRWKGHSCLKVYQKLQMGSDTGDWMG